MTTTIGWRRRTASLVAAGGLLLGGLVALPSAAAAAEPSPAAQSGVDWIERELVANDYVLGGLAGPGTADWGLTIDALIAIAAAGRGGEVSDQMVERLKTDGDDFIRNANVNEMGGRAKVAYALLLAGEDPTSFDIDGESVDLIATIRDSMQDNGRLGAYTNHFGQSLAILALARTDEGVPAEAVDYIETLQCTDETHANYGGFGWGAGNCGSVDGDATGFELSALLAAGKDASDPAIARAVEWMENNQASNGSFAPSYNPALGNTNSTGLIANAALQIATPASIAVAQKAEGFVESLQITTDNATVDSDDPNTGGGLATGWIGAIAYSQAGFDTAVSGGIPQNSTDQWRRATTQAVLGLGLPGLSEISLESQGPAATALTLTAPSSLTAGTGGQAVVLVSPASATGDIELRGLPGGAVTSAISGGKATFPLPKGLAVGSYSLSAHYGGDGTYAAADSSAVSVKVAKVAAKVTLSGATSKAYGRTAKVTVKVAAAGGTPTGKVTLSGTGSPTTKALSGGKATFTLPRTLKVRSYRLKATYKGSATLGAAASTRGVKVSKGAVKKPTLKVTKKATRKRRGKVRVTVGAASGLAKPGGKVRLVLKKGKKSRTVNVRLAGGTRNVTLPKLAKGTWRVKVTYRGNGTYKAKKSKTYRIKVR